MMESVSTIEVLITLPRIEKSKKLILKMNLRRKLQTSGGFSKEAEYKVKGSSH